MILLLWDGQEILELHIDDSDVFDVRVYGVTWSLGADTYEGHEVGYVMVAGRMFHVDFDKAMEAIVDIVNNSLLIAEVEPLEPPGAD